MDTWRALAVELAEQLRAAPEPSGETLELLERFDVKYEVEDRIDTAYELTPEDRYGEAVQNVVDGTLAELQLALESELDGDHLELRGLHAAIEVVESFQTGGFGRKVQSIEKQLAAMKDVVGHRPDNSYESDAVTDPDAREVVTLIWVLKVLKGTPTPTPESTP